MKKGDVFRFIDNPSYPRNEHFTVVRKSKDYLDCTTSRFPGVTHCFPMYRETFKRFPIEHLDDASLMLAIANVIGNTPVGEEVDFDRTAQELEVTV